jgi:hypothetical protein
MPVKYTLLVNRDEVSLELLRYVDKNIFRINKNNVRVVPMIVSSTKGMIDKLRAAGITRLPALVVPDGNLIGLRSIVEHLDKLGEHIGSSRPGLAPSIDNTHDWLMREMFEVDRTGKRIPRTDHDDDEAEDNKKDIERRLKDYSQNAPKHQRNVGRGGYENDDDDDEPMDRNARAPRGRPERPPRSGGRDRMNRDDHGNVDIPMISDNIADGAHLLGGTPGDNLNMSQYSRDMGDADGDKMWNAFMNNMSESSSF